MKQERVAFLFLGELHLIPHLFPIAVALARRADAPSVTLFVATSVHEEILRDACARLDLTQVRIARVNGFLEGAPGSRDMPKLPSKPVVLLRNALTFLSQDVVVVAERTSLWLPLFARRRGARFVYNEHGAAPLANFKTARNRYAHCLLMPSDAMAHHAAAALGSSTSVEVVGYIKPDFIRMLATARQRPSFPAHRPTVVYTPHWERARSSWWSAGEAVLRYFAESGRYNLVLAPHIRLPLFDPDFEARVAPFRDSAHIHIDSRSFSLIDQTYVDAADIYLGDGSSQAVEFARNPRPIVFLNPDRIAWQTSDRFSLWSMGDVIEDVAALDGALAAAPERHARYADVQRSYVARLMGADDGCASERAADVVQRVLRRA